MRKQLALTLLWLSTAVVTQLPLKADTDDSPAAVVIDDRDSRCQFEGGIRFDGAGREATVQGGITASQAADAKVIWKPGVTGRYYLQVHWQTQRAGHERQAVYTVNSAGIDPQRFIVNQKLVAAGDALEITTWNFVASGWHTLGTHAWLLDADSTVELTKLSASTEWLIADALRVAKDLVVDELSASAFYPTGMWELRPVRVPGAENTQVAMSGSTHALVRLVPGLSGEHVLSLSWAADPGNTSRAHYEVDLDGDAGTVDDQVVLEIDQRLLADQKTAGTDFVWSGWYELPHSLALQTSSSVTLRNAATKGRLIADGLKLRAVDDPPCSTPISLPHREQPVELPRGAIEDGSGLAEITAAFRPVKKVSALEPLKVESVLLRGRLGQRHRANADYLLWLLAQNEEFMLNPYRLRDNGKFECEWDGEYAGKWLDAAVLTAVNLHHEQLKQKLDSLSRAVRREQDSDGCVGTESALRRGRNQWGTWMPWYMITGWLDQYEQYNEEAALVAAWRAARWILDFYGPITGDNLLFYQYATMEGGSNVALIDQLCRLYQHTGDAEILQFARDAVRQFPRFAAMKQTGKAPAVHVYVLLADLGAAVQLAVLDNDHEQLAWLERVWEEIHQQYLYPTGSLSRDEQLVAPSDEANGHHQETCATVEWLLFCHRLYLATGKVRYQHAVEEVVYNALLGAQSVDGQKWMYFTPLRYEKKWFSGGTRCCYHSGPRGIARLPLLVYALDAEGVRVDLFEASAAQLQSGGVPLRIEQQTDYPASGETILTLRPERPAEFSLRVRIPEWAAGVSVQLNDKPMPWPGEPGEYFTLRRIFSPGDQVRLQWDLPVRLRPLADEGVALVRGPEVLAVDSRDNPNLDLDAVTIPDRVELQAAEPDGDRRRYRAALLVAGALQPVLLTPFADAGNNDARFRTVFPHATGQPAQDRSTDEASGG